jgi:glucokinase
MMKYVAGIDVGGTNTRIALIDENYHIVQRIQFSSETHDPDQAVKQIADTINKLKYPVMSISLSCPGPLDLIQQKVLTPPNLPGWHFYPIAEKLHEATDLPVKLENDANLAGLAEAVLGAGRNKKYVQFLTISTGIGGGMIVDGKIYHGAHGFAQEVANSIMWKNGPQHGDLKAGSIESIASGTAITNRANQAGLKAAHAGEVNELALAGNQKAAEIMEDAYEYLSSFIAILYAVNDPDIVVLSGSVALKIPGFIEELEKRTRQKVYTVMQDNIMLKRAELDEDCGLIGAGILAFQQ